jgi:hypothetical protein
MSQRRLVALCLMIAIVVLPGTALAQRSLADVLGRPATPEGQPKSYLEEVMLFSYIENSYVFNLGGAGRGGVNELRYYDFDGATRSTWRSSASRRLRPTATGWAMAWS